MAGAAASYFFVHIMKTGGATFRQHIYANFDAGEVYPDPAQDTDLVNANIRIDYLLGLPRERHSGIRVYTGHFPFVVSELVGRDLVTLTILRDPVERTISYLKQCQRYSEQHHDLSYEQIYEDPIHYPFFIHNHQSKLFAMTAGDPLESYLDQIDVDDRRLQIATSNLEKVDVLGLTEHHDEFLGEVARRFGWRFDERANWRVSEQRLEASPALRRRIADDNAADVAFYEHAQRVYHRRRGPGRG